MPRSTYLPVAPSDFGIFGTMKEKLIGVEHDSNESLQSQILKILEGFLKSLFSRTHNKRINYQSQLVLAVLQN